MASYDPYDAPTRERTTKRYYREERRDERDPRYVERDSYLNVQRDLVPRPRENSDLSVEEIRRDFPPPGYASRDVRRARSAGHGYYADDYDDRQSHYSRDRDDRGYYDRDYDRRGSHKKAGGSVYYEEEERKKARMLSKQEQIIAAVTGAALAIGGKELYDRREASQHGTDVQRNVLTSAALGAAGALAGYSGTELYNKTKEKEEKKSTYVVHKGRDGKVTEYYTDDDEESVSVKDKKGHKNFLESALAAAGLGGAVKALTGRDDKSDTRSRRGGSRSRSRSRGRGEGANKIQKAAMASLIAGATEAFRVSKEPGSWKGEKAKRILTAAAGAATIDAAQNPDKAGSKLGIAESVIGGLLGNRVLNGSKKNIEEDEKTGRSRSRSRARSRDGGGGGVSGLAALATAGLGAFGAKKIMDNRERSRSRRRSADSYDDRDGSPDRRRQRSRSRSVVDSARRGLAKMGIGNGPDDDDDVRDRRDRSRRDYDDYDDASTRRGGSKRGGRGKDDYDDYGRDHRDDRSARGSGRDRSRSRSRQRSERGAVTKRRDASRGSASSSDLGDSDEDEKRAKKMRGKQLITTGLAAVATIHAAHNVYQSMEKRNARHKAVKEGRLSEEEAKKLKSKALLQDAASVGIAALGIKGALSELKEARETAHEVREWKEKKAERHMRRLERQKQLANGNGSRSRSRGGDGYSDNDSDYGNSNGGPRYNDGNPYAYALPPSR
ncbi:hypothetical protein QBC46DRAFT_90147 [Diplogelasinospora grovesii]|uniref:Uncharacterized protein n=1 Tax=Diplogelasinospora grovesii TaxID=303347 RepID=A0AAN6NBA3_9PEZI|nr:hypothetical protein QBC46DRAFT_90147 [Diplogelasinospora grovesii]